MDEKLKRRCIFIDDATWALSAKAAKKNGRSQASWIRESIKRCLDARKGTLKQPV